jgi:aspartyl-tRNA(Asn)/glutamyl-tRNA(Gln) amidotransferase subunit B
MSQGSLRCDANVSVRPAGSQELGTKTELKNMNSFAFLERGIRAEIERQVAALRAGDAVVQETLHYDPRTGALTPLRSKEEAHDYRYFPEPDLVPLVVSAELRDSAQAALPTELPVERATRFEHELGLSAGRARELAFRAELGDYFERALEAAGIDGGADPVELSNWIPQLVERIPRDSDPADSKVAPESLATLAAMVKAREVSRDAAREVLSMLVEQGGDPHAIVEREGLRAISGEDDGLGELVDQAIAADPSAAEQVRAGNMRAIGPLVGYVMRETKGRADGGEVTRLIRERLGSA